MGKNVILISFYRNHIEVTIDNQTFRRRKREQIRVIKEIDLNKDTSFILWKKTDKYVVEI